METDIGILGGGLAGLSLAYFLANKSLCVLEKGDDFGGLARSYQKNGIAYDIGPHIIFSKNEKALNFLNTISKNAKHRRSNKIFHKGKYITYPFENFLAQMENPQDIEYCLKTFLNNPYADKPAHNMLDFFLATFGEGITKLYLQPYNEKIWKFDPQLMDTQMVERIPKPPQQDIINSAQGKFTEGYTHQLHFSYPVSGGTQSIVNGLVQDLGQRPGVLLKKNSEVKSVARDPTGWKVQTTSGEYKFKKLINCLPVHELIEVLADVPEDIKKIKNNLQFNSIYIVIINVDKETLGDNFAVMVADKEIIFHRLSRLDFMGGEYHLPGSTTLMLEITFRENDKYSKMTERELTERCIADLIKLKFIKNKAAVKFTDIRKEKYAYVIYDLKHRQNCDKILAYLNQLEIASNGRFAEFEYLNMDKIVEHSMFLAEKLK